MKIFNLYFRATSEVASAPLLPFIKKFIAIQPYSDSTHEPEDFISCTRIFLDLVSLPDDDSIEIDLRQTAVYLLAYLDKLAFPHISPSSLNKVNYLWKIGRNAEKFFFSHLSIMDKTFGDGEWVAG